MGRNFADTSSDKIDLGDITTARFQAGSTWTVLAFFRSVQTTNDQQVLVAKWGNQNLRQIAFRLRGQAQPEPLQVIFNDATAITSSTDLTVGIWHLGALSCDGGGASGTLTLHSFEMDGTVKDDGITGSITGDQSNLTAPVTIGLRDVANDQMDGDIAYVAYINSELTKPQLLEYLRDPAGVVAQFQATSGVEFFLPLGLGSPEPDWSGNGNSGTVSGTTIGDSPPVRSPYWSIGAPSSTAAGGSTDFPRSLDASAVGTTATVVDVGISAASSAVGTVTSAPVHDTPRSLDTSAVGTTATVVDVGVSAASSAVGTTATVVDVGVSAASSAVGTTATVTDVGISAAASAVGTVATSRQKDSPRPLDASAVGTTATVVDVGISAASSAVGTTATVVDVGVSAASSAVGTTATVVDVGISAASSAVGTTTTVVDVGISAASTAVGTVNAPGVHETPGSTDFPRSMDSSAVGTTATVIDVGISAATSAVGTVTTSQQKDSPRPFDASAVGTTTAVVDVGVSVASSAVGTTANVVDVGISAASSAVGTVAATGQHDISRALGASASATYSSAVDVGIAAAASAAATFASSRALDAIRAFAASASGTADATGVQDNGEPPRTIFVAGVICRDVDASSQPGTHTAGSIPRGTMS